MSLFDFLTGAFFIFNILSVFLSLCFLLFKYSFGLQPKFNWILLAFNVVCFIPYQIAMSSDIRVDLFLMYPAFFIIFVFCFIHEFV